MALVLTITTGRIDRERTEAFQVTFQTLLSRRFEQASFLRQAMLVHLGDGVWQMQTLWDSTVAQNHPVDNDVPLTVRIFRDFGADLLDPEEINPNYPSSESNEGSQSDRSSAPSRSPSPLAGRPQTAQSVPVRAA